MKIIDYVNSNEALRVNYITSKYYKEIIDSISNNELEDENTVICTLLDILYYQCELYDVLLNNISKYGDNTIIEKCVYDINNILGGLTS